jgi:hypothetical protein
MRDHKRPRKFGGPSVAENIVRCCQMCNVIKSSRPDELFVVFFSFPSNTGAEYRAADPDGGTSISAMSRKINLWGHELWQSPAAQVSELGGRELCSGQTAESKSRAVC